MTMVPTSSAARMLDRVDDTGNHLVVATGSS